MSATAMTGFVAMILGLAPAASSDAQTNPPSAYNVVWTTPSRDSSGSMPIGNGDIGLNVWVEQDGDLRFYIAKTDAWSENVRLLKLGGVRIRLSPNPFRRVSRSARRCGFVRLRSRSGPARRIARS